jgi:transposase
MGSGIARLVTIPGVGQRTAEVIVAQTGGDMTRSPTAAHLAAWAGLAPIGASHRMSAFDAAQRDIARMAQESPYALSARSILPPAARVIMVHVD